MEIREFRDLVFAAGREAGLEEMEIYFSRTKNFSTRVFQEEVDNYTISEGQGVGFRASYQGKVGYAYAETLDLYSVDFLVNDAKANAQIIDSDDEIEFFSGSPAYPEINAYNSALENISATQKIEFAKALETEALQTDKRVSMVNVASCGYQETTLYISNNIGLEQSFKRNSMHGFVSAIVRGEEQVKTGRRMTFSSDWNEFDANYLASEAVKEAVSLLGATSVSSGDYSVILRHDVARGLLSTFASIFSAEAVQKGLSLLAGKLNETIASPVITLVDDPLLKNGGASAPFDGEGVATYTKKLIEKGKLRTFLHNLKSAKKDGIKSTGNASRASFSAPIGISATNLFIESGELTFHELIAEMGNGIIIIDVQGLHSGANPVSGDFSLGAYGYLVENGEVSQAVEQITISGNFFKVLQDVTAVASDLEFGSPSLHGHVGSPSLLIRNLAIAGI